MSAAHDNERPPSTDAMPPQRQTLLTQHGSGTPLPVDSGETLALTAVSPADETLTQSIAGYDLEGELGRGGMGVVYKARQRGLNRTVALKMILHSAHASAEERERFRREARALAGLRHEGIVQVYEVGEHEGKPFFSLEYSETGPAPRRIRHTSARLNNSSQRGKGAPRRSPQSGRTPKIVGGRA